MKDLIEGRRVQGKWGDLAQLDEAKVDDSTLKKVAKMVQGNDHGGALALGAKMIGATKLAKLFGYINKIADVAGHTPSAMIRYRDELKDDLAKLTKQHLSKEDHVKFWDVF